MKVGDMETKFIKVVIFKNNFFVQNLNAKFIKIHDFNTNVPKFYLGKK